MFREAGIERNCLERRLACVRSGRKHAQPCKQIRFIQKYQSTSSGTSKTLSLGPRRLTTAALQQKLFYCVSQLNVKQLSSSLIGTILYIWWFYAVFHHRAFAGFRATLSRTLKALHIVRLSIQSSMDNKSDFKFSVRISALEPTPRTALWLKHTRARTYRREKHLSARAGNLTAVSLGWRTL